MWALGSRENKDQELNDLLSQLAAVQKQEPASQLNERCEGACVALQALVGRDGARSSTDASCVTVSVVCCLRRAWNARGESLQLHLNAGWPWRSF